MCLMVIKALEPQAPQARRRNIERRSPAPAGPFDNRTALQRKVSCSKDIYIYISTPMNPP